MTGFRGFTVALAVFMLMGCGSGGSEVAPPVRVVTFQGAEVGILADQGLSASNAELKGSGTIIFRKPLPDPDNNYLLSFSLEKQGSLSLVTNAQLGLKAPIALVFTRDGDRLDIALKDGETEFSIEEDFPKVSATGAVTLDVDIHKHGHVILWIGSKRNEYTFTSEVSGSLWGLKLNQARVTTAQVRVAKEEG